MLVELSALWIVILNFTVIPAAQLSLSWLVVRAPQNWFRFQSFLFLERSWEHNARIYELMGIKTWKDWLPDGAPWVGGFPKKSLMRRDPEYVREFLLETCRGEAAHLVQIPGVLLTLIWNPWPLAAGIIVLYALLSNLPCVVVQRHTRIRLLHLLRQIEKKELIRP